MCGFAIHLFSYIMILDNRIVLPEEKREIIEEFFVQNGIEDYLKDIYWVEFRRGIGDY